MNNFSLKLVIVISLLDYNLVFSNIDLPCSYHDTVDLSNSEKHLNGSYFYDGIEIPSYLVSTYDHSYINFREKISIKSHLRGCLCKIRSCIKWCCDLNQIYLYNELKCKNHTENITSDIIMRTESNENITRNVKTYFYGLSSRLPCKYIYALRSNKYKEDKWQLFENSSLLLPAMNQLKSKDEYCFAVDKFADQYYVVPFICSVTGDDASLSLRDTIYACSLLSSVLCMVITIIVYLWIPELRNLHGKALSCYLFGLSVGYSIMGYMLLKGSTQISPSTCSVIGFLCYYFFMAAFFWSTVISFDLWSNFNGRKLRSQYTEQQHFIVYSIYSWGLALCFLVIAILIQNSNYIADIYKPAIGSNQYCFLNVQTNWSATIYFYGPILIVIIFNILMFIQTSIKIHHVQCEMSKIMETQENQRIMKSDKDNVLKSRFGLYFRLFIIMGVTWTMQIITYLAGKHPIYNFLIYICDTCNTLQGLAILILFVLKKEIKRLLFKQYYRSKDRKMSRQYSRTTSSNIGIGMLGIKSENSTKV